MNHTFDLGKISTIQVSKRIFILGLAIALPLFIGIALYNYNLNIMLFVIISMITTNYIMNKVSMKYMKIDVKGPLIYIYYNNVLVYNNEVLNLNYIRTLYQTPKLGEIQGELFFNNQKYSISALGNSEGKVAWESFYETLEKDYHFTKEKVTFSLLTHNFQGVDYVEFRNPNFIPNQR